MGLRQTTLQKLIYQAFGEGGIKRLVSDDILQLSCRGAISDCYKKLGGQLALPPLRLGPWDISSKDFIIELDEERHFNRYRLITLETEYYNHNEHKSFDVLSYKRYCVDNENICLKAAKWGGNWKNNSTERQFRKSDQEGVLGEGGSSRWRQRAYYDFTKDIAAHSLGIPLFRLSIYDQVDHMTLGDHLNARQVNKKAILDYVSFKIAN